MNGLFLKSLFCLFLLTPVGGGIPHGVFPEMGPGGNMGQLTEHRPRWAGTHETAQSSPDTKQKRSKAQADTEAREGAGVDPMEGKKQGRKRGSVSWAPDLAKDLVPESVSDSVSGSLTDIAAHLGLVQDQAVETVSKPETKQARKFSVGSSANQDTARPRRESAGETPPHRVTRGVFTFKSVLLYSFHVSVTEALYWCSSLQGKSL